MTFFETLEKYQRNRSELLHKSEDYSFFAENKNLLTPIIMFRGLERPKDEFDIIRANIIIRSLLNKKKLDQLIVYAFKESKMKTEEVASFIHEEMTGMPYVKQENIKAYVPIFSQSINEFYYEDFGKLLAQPYSTLITSYFSSCIDPFEVYKFDLFDSLFTKLITIYRDDKIMVALHYDFKTIYIINNQGRLESKICLFDKFMKRPNFTHIFDRIQPAVKAYLANDKIGFIKSLLENELISMKLLSKIDPSDEEKVIKALEAK